MSRRLLLGTYRAASGWTIPSAIHLRSPLSTTTPRLSKLPHVIRAARPQTGLSFFWLLIAAGTLLGSMAVVAAWTGPDSPHGPLRVAFTLANSLPRVLLWLMMAHGIGWPLRRLLLGSNTGGSGTIAMQLALGSAAAMWLALALASLGLLGGGPVSTSGSGASVPSGAIAWCLVVGGAVLGVASQRFDPPVASESGQSPWGLAAIPAVAVLLVAACAAPGWLWSSEFGGYDALSYHLQLPKEWLLQGELGATPHCVYGHLPSFVEAAFLHLMLLHGDDAHAAIKAAPTCQLLHACLALLAARVAAEAAHAWLPEAPAARRSLAAGVAAVVVLATPWTIVVGSLAYNDMAVCLFLAAALRLLAPPPDGVACTRAASLRLGAALGVLVGAAAGAKLTAAGFAVLPVAAVVLLTRGRGASDATSTSDWTSALRTLAAMALLSAVVLAPWLIRNAATVDNPVFPFATTLFGSGPWSAEQVERFADGHRTETPWHDRPARLLQQWLAFGVGSNPSPGEPWRMQWALTPLLALFGASVLLARGGTRRRGLALVVVLAVQLGFWLVATHLQSRFLLPTLIPAALLAALAVGTLPIERWRPAGAAAMAIGLVLLSMAPVLLYRSEGNGAPGAAIGLIPLFTGDLQAQALRESAPPAQAQIVAAATPSLFLNHLLPPNSRVLLIGEARAFYFRGDPARYDWATVWDTNPLAPIIAAAPEDPSRWPAALRTAGFTHLLIDPSMIERWSASGWLDPLLTLDRLRRLATSPHRVIHRFPGGAVLVELAKE